MQAREISTLIFFDVETTGLFKDSRNNPLLNPNRCEENWRDRCKRLENLVNSDGNGNCYPKITKIAFVSVPLQLFREGIDAMKETLPAATVPIAVNVHVSQVDPRLSENEWMEYESERRRIPKIRAFAKVRSVYSQRANFCQTTENTNATDSQKRCEYCKDYDQLREQMEELTQENGSLLDKYRRALAETENLRKRSQRQIEDTKTFAIQGFCKDLLEVADVLNLAVSSFENEKADKESFENLHQGVKMTKDVLTKTFSKHGLVAVSPIGRKFDPNFHEAIFEVPNEQAKHPPGHIAEVLSIGYSLHDRPIRPAKVGVVKMP